jgi:glutathione synthase/RimK-type ligase-like ATP-grasp enzyme
MIIHPRILILGSRFDFSCDYVVVKLQARGVPYLRLNSEDLDSWNISLDPLNREVRLVYGSTEYQLTPQSLKSIWYRRACYPRDYAFWHVSVDEQLKRSQSAAFFRSFLMFEECFWMNNPQSTYRAEQKAVQLAIATRIGFTVPKTRFTNSLEELDEIPGNAIVVKGIDTVIAYEGGREYFGFTNIFQKTALASESLREIPVTVQELLSPKRDLRVTVVRDRVFTAEILKEGRGIEGDWRVTKSGLEYIAHELPNELQERCITLLRNLDLNFGGIDLALTSDGYQFIEINPTGEWAWLVDEAKLAIDEAIADALSA